MNEIIDGKYEILSRIGSGGTSVVYRARRLTDNLIVAIKVMREEYADDEEHEKKFRREVEAVSKMAHRNIRKILAVGRWNGSLYMVTEFIDGMTLKDLIAQGPIPAKKALDYALQIAAGIEHAHFKKVIHRDIKPQNILISDDGTVKLADFGIARVISQSTLTMGGEDVVGSVHYLSPEQAKGSVVDERTDIYSFGILMYEMFTGQLPFSGNEAVSVAMKQIKQMPVPPMQVSSVPKGINDIIMKCIQKDPSMRYQSASELREDLLLYAANPLGFEVIPERQNKAPVTDSLDEEGVMVRTVRTENVMANRAPVGKTAAQDVFVEAPSEEDESEEEEQMTDAAEAGIIGRKRKKKMAVLIVSLILGVLVLGAGVFLVLQLNNQNSSATGWSETEMPAVTGQTEAVARKLIQSKNLVVRNVEHTNSPTVPEGYVISQEPAAGEKVTTNAIVTLYISTGAKQIQVENVVGRTEEEARETLERAGFHVNVEYTTEGTAANGSVINETNAGETISEGSTITIVVKKEKKKIVLTVPELYGKSVEDATAAAKQAGFTVSAVSGTRDNTVIGVYQQSLPAGYQVYYYEGQEGTYYSGEDVPVTDMNIRIWVCTGPVPKVYTGTYSFDLPSGLTFGDKVEIWFKVNNRYVEEKTQTVSQRVGTVTDFYLTEEKDQKVTCILFVNNETKAQIVITCSDIYTAGQTNE